MAPVRRGWWTGVLAAVFSAVMGGCGDPAVKTHAFRIERTDQAIGGPVASARIGDYLLENGVVRAVVEQGGSSRTPLDLGGSLVDLDLVRSETRFQGGKGLDHLGQIFPTANLYVARSLGERSVRVSSPSEAVAEVTAAEQAVPVQKVLGALGLLLSSDFFPDNPLQESGIRVYTEYRLLPGEQLLRMRTTVGFDTPFCRPQPEDQCNATCDDILYDADCSCPKIPARCTAGISAINATPLPDRPEPMGLSDILLGDLGRPLGAKLCNAQRPCTGGDSCVTIASGSQVCRGPAARDPGVFIGDMLLFGGQLGLFIPGTGYDSETDIRRLFDSGQDTLSEPLKLDAVYALGKGVSYGYAQATGKVLSPIFGGPFSMGAVAAASCPRSDLTCLDNKLVRAERWVSVGTGDPASALEPVLKARGVALGEVRGNVRTLHTGDPLSGAEVFALSDPRSLPCDEACVARCGDLSALSDADLSRHSVPALFALNKCRTVGGAYLEGMTAIVTSAKTDPGTDARKDGDFRLALPAGRYVLVAQNGPKALSAPLPVTVAVNERTVANFALQEPGRIQYSIFDEAGQLSPGRITLGRCLPKQPCGEGRPACASGEACQAGACACLREQVQPLEFGGGRFSDGVLAFDQTAGGRGQLELAPGEYEVLFSRGPHRSTDRQTIRVEPNVTTQVTGKLIRQVDTNGFAAADFHVHAERSIDSGLQMEDRVTSFLAEDMDFLSSSDHDVLSWYEPLIERMGVRRLLGTQVGAEVTTQELGHFIGYPMKYREFTVEEPITPIIGAGAPEWRDKVPKDIFQSMRDVADPGHPFVVEVPHPYSYFDYYGITPGSLEPVASIISLVNPLIESQNFSGEFDAMELMNAKSFDLTRRPTVGDLRFYSRGLDELARRRAELGEARYQREVYEISTEMTRRILHRTKPEADAALAAKGVEFDCKCGSDGDCGGGRVCDAAVMKCVNPQDLSKGGTPPPDEYLCRALRGVTDDWFTMLNRGVRRSGVGGSDVHGLYGYEAGLPRTLIKTGATTGPYLTSDEITQGVLDAKTVVTNGPVIHVAINGAGVGETTTMPSGSTVSLDLRVERADWFDVDRIEVYRNGELIHWISGCGSVRPDATEPHAHSCIPQGTGDVVAYAEVLADKPQRDAWYVVIALGLDGRTLAPVYASAAQSRLGTFEITQKVFDLIPTLSAIKTPRFPSLYPTFPMAVTNPIYVDLNADGFKPELRGPSWCVKGRDLNCNN